MLRPSVANRGPVRVTRPLNRSEKSSPSKTSSTSRPLQELSGDRTVRIPRPVSRSGSENQPLVVTEDTSDEPQGARRPPSRKNSAARDLFGRSNVIPEGMRAPVTEVLSPATASRPPSRPGSARSSPSTPLPSPPPRETIRTAQACFRSSLGSEFLGLFAN